MSQITIYPGASVIVGGVPGVGCELLFTNGCAVVLPGLDYVRVGTNRTFIGNVHSGAVVSVDAAGRCALVDGPDLIGSVSWGFGLTISIVGTLLFVRFLAGFGQRTALGSSNAAE